MLTIQSRIYGHLKVSALRVRNGVYSYVREITNSNTENFKGQRPYAVFPYPNGKRNTYNPRSSLLNRND